MMTPMDDAGDMKGHSLSTVELGRKHPREIATTAFDNGHVPVFLTALCELLMCSDPTPLTPEKDKDIKHAADVMARKLGFTGWIEAYHGLTNG